MKQLSMLALSLCAALAIPAQADQHLKQERAYGYELMSPQERSDYQDRMRAAKTEQEPEQIRLEYHKTMQARARAQGKTLPDLPPAAGRPWTWHGAGRWHGPPVAAAWDRAIIADLKVRLE